MEKWRKIKGFPKYSVSDSGKIKGPRKQILKPVEGSSGYHKVTLCRNGEHVDKRINRLVAEAFLPNPGRLPIVMHRDNNRKNNEAANLSWGTTAENNQYMYDCGRHPINLTDASREKAYSIRRSPVLAIEVSNGETMTFASQHDAARILGVSQQHIWGVLNGYRKTTGGYKFEYLNEGEFNNAD